MNSGIMHGGTYAEYAGQVLRVDGPGGKRLAIESDYDATIHNYVAQHGNPDYILVESRYEVKVLYLEDSQTVVFTRGTLQTASVVKVIDGLSDGLLKRITKEDRARLQEARAKAKAAAATAPARLAEEKAAAEAARLRAEADAARALMDAATAKDKLAPQRVASEAARLRAEADLARAKLEAVQANNALSQATQRAAVSKPPEIPDPTAKDVKSKSVSGTNQSAVASKSVGASSTDPRKLAERYCATRKGAVVPYEQCVPPTLLDLTSGHTTPTELEEKIRWNIEEAGKPKPTAPRALSSGPVGSPSLAYIEGIYNGQHYQQLVGIDEDARRRIFVALVEYQDRTGDDDGSFAAIAKKYSIPEKAVGAIFGEARVKMWPLPPQP